MISHYYGGQLYCYNFVYFGAEVKCLHIWFIADKVAPYKKLEGGVKFIDEIPKAPSGKILRRKLKDLGAESKL